MEPDPDDALQHSEEPDPDENTSSPLNHALLPVMDTRSRIPGQVYSRTEPDPDNLSIDQKHTSSRGFNEPDPDDMLIKEEATQEPDPDERMEMVGEPDPDESLRVNEEPDPDASAAESGRVEPDPDENARDLDLGMVDGEIARIQDSTAAAMARLQNAITTLKRQASPSETNATIQVLFTIFRYVPQLNIL